MQEFWKKSVIFKNNFIMSCGEMTETSSPNHIVCKLLLSTWVHFFNFYLRHNLKMYLYFKLSHAVVKLVYFCF